MRTSSRRFTLLTLGAIICGSSTFAATFQLVGSDPVPIVLIKGTTFAFAANPLGGGVIEFQNVTGTVLTSLEFFANIPNPNAGCVPAPAFNLTYLSVNELDNTGITYAVTTDCPGAPVDHFRLTILGTDLPDTTGVFTVTLNDPGQVGENGSGGWGGATFTGRVTTLDAIVPEPATYALIGAGLAALAISRRRRSA